MPMNRQPSEVFYGEPVAFMKDHRMDASMSRRQIVGGAGVGLAAAAAAPALAQGGTAPAIAAPMQDPRGKHPAPPFPRQEQPWPGLASKMQPPVDHGETSYKRLRTSRRSQGSDHRRRLGHGPRRRHRLRSRGCRRRDQLFPHRGARCQGSSSSLRSAPRAARRVAIPGDLRDESLLQAAWSLSTRCKRAWRPRHPRLQRRAAAGAQVDRSISRPSSSTGR